MLEADERQRQKQKSVLISVQIVEKRNALEEKHHLNKCQSEHSPVMGPAWDNTTMTFTDLERRVRVRKWDGVRHDEGLCRDLIYYHGKFFDGF